MGKETWTPSSESTRLPQITVSTINNYERVQREKVAAALAKRAHLLGNGESIKGLSAKELCDLIARSLNAIRQRPVSKEEKSTTVFPSQS